MTPTDCPRFQTCSAAICPLAPAEGYHRNGEPVCHYLLATGKAGADERYGHDPVFHACRTALPVITARFPDIGYRVTAAARTGFRKSNLPARPAASPAA
jgi:hypothetical protein